MEILNKYPLLKDGYEELECVNCDTVCYPETKRASGTIVYSSHECKSEFEMYSTNRSFEINSEGELIFDGKII